MSINLYVIICCHYFNSCYKSLNGLRKRYKNQKRAGYKRKQEDLREETIARKHQQLHNLMGSISFNR